MGRRSAAQARSTNFETRNKFEYRMTKISFDLNLVFGIRFVLRISNFVLSSLILNG